MWGKDMPAQRITLLGVGSVYHLGWFVSLGVLHISEGTKRSRTETLVVVAARSRLYPTW